MALQVIQEETGGRKVLVVKASDKLSQEDYEHFIPEVERLIKAQGKIRLLFEMHDFHGWEMGALWQDIKFDLKHFADIERLAMIGEKKWEEWMAKFCQPFTRAEIRYFDQHQAEEARNWVTGK